MPNGKKPNIGDVNNNFIIQNSAHNKDKKIFAN